MVVALVVVVLGVVVAALVVDVEGVVVVALVVVVVVVVPLHLNQSRAIRTINT